MMKNRFLPIIALLGISSLLFLSCGKNECDSNCDAVFPEVHFKIVNSTGQNLTCGPNKLYSSEKVAIKSYENAVLVDATKAYAGDSSQASTGLVFVPASLSTQYYLYLNNVRTDSFQLSYQVNQGKSDCCPTFNSITSIKLNNAAVTMPFSVVK